MVDQNLLISALVFGVVFALIVFAYGLIVPMILGRPRHMMPIMDIAVLALFIAVVVFLMRVSGLWERLAMHV